MIVAFTQSAFVPLKLGRTHKLIIYGFLIGLRKKKEPSIDIPGVYI